MIARSDYGTGKGYIHNAIRPDFLAIAPTLGPAFSRFAFPDDLPSGAWIDAPEFLPAGACIAGDNCEAFQSTAWR